MVIFTNTESRIVMASEGGAVAQWVQFSFCKMERVLEMDSGNGCTRIVLNHY